MNQNLKSESEGEIIATSEDIIPTLQKVLSISEFQWQQYESEQKIRIIQNKLQSGHSVTDIFFDLGHNDIKEHFEYIRKNNIKLPVVEIIYEVATITYLDRQPCELIKVGYYNNATLRQNNNIKNTNTNKQ